MRRRRQKNNLLPKMLGIALLVNAILLPILAQMGVFKNVGGRHLDQVQLVKLPPEKKPPAPKKQPPKRVAKTRPHPAAHTASRTSTSRPSRPNPNQPKVVVASGGTGGGGSCRLGVRSCRRASSVHRRASSASQNFTDRQPRSRPVSRLYQIRSRAAIRLA